ncbi:hypothetical protein [Arthrobacter sp. OY3WO11]|uniref:hypothetical protein n=1 Tax=Arthrobacter sp. OY3WO11 TaxID=1835723 RepID=UPI0007D03A9E|nr:hypothetical protein [Arthrobacter sp. OY3WO11]OAE01874.1 hypothetical protein A6A22_10935 [Arthrobacter sp. OY3WO11]
MEVLVVTLETAKKLKAAGFPQEAPNYWYEFGDTSDGVTHELRTDTKCGFGRYSAAPTAQEIADQLPRKLRLDAPNAGTNLMLKIRPTQSSAGWRVGYYNSTTRQDLRKQIVEILAPTMAEALALLWLKLQEAK